MNFGLMVTATPGSTSVICGYETVSSLDATFSVVDALSVVASISVVLVVVVDEAIVRCSVAIVSFLLDLLLLALVLFSKSF